MYRAGSLHNWKKNDRNKNCVDLRENIFNTKCQYWWQDSGPSAYFFAMHFNSVMNGMPQTFHFTFSSPFPHLPIGMQKFTLQVEGRKKLARLRVESFFKMFLAHISLLLHAIQNFAYEEKTGFGPSPTCRGHSCSLYLIRFVSSGREYVPAR